MHPSEKLWIDEQGPFPVVRPASVAEVGDIVRRAAAEERGLFPLGGRTRLDLGFSPAKSGQGVDLNGLDQVLDYPARDMTITVQAGITMARLQEILKGEKQRLPIDVPCPERTTLGGAMATNTSGPRRYGFGTLRDYVIGLTTINDEGHETKAGGRVVKNVAGYDLCKLHIGALGTLGIITQVTLKLKLLPEESAIVLFRCDLPVLGTIFDLLHATRTRPVCLEVFNPRAAETLTGQSAWTIAVGFEEAAQTVHWQVQQLVKELAAARIHGADTFANSATEPLWRKMSEGMLQPEVGFSCKVNLLSHAVARLCQRTSGVASLALQAQAGSGIAHVHLLGQPTLDDATALLALLREEAGKAEGNVIILRCPTDWKKTLPVWGMSRGDAALMATIRDRFDPRRIFNPGRFLTR